MKKLQIKEKIDSISIYDFEGPLSKNIINIIDLYDNYSKKYPQATDIYLEYQSHEDNYSNNNEEFSVFIKRLENDKEYNNRIKKTNKLKIKEKQDYKTYLKLKKKFEKK